MSTLFTEQHLKSMLKSAKSGNRVYFAFGKNQEDVCFLVADDTLESSALLTKLKAHHKVKKFTHGTLEVASSKIILHPQSSMANLKKLAQAWLKSQDLPYSKIVIGNDDEEDGDLIMGRSAEERKEVETVGYAILDVIDRYGLDKYKVPPQYEESIRYLGYAVHAKHLDGEEKWKYFEEAVKGLAPALSLQDWDPAMQRWIETNILTALRKARKQVEADRAQTRIADQVEETENPALAAAKDRKNLQRQIKTIVQGSGGTFKLLKQALKEDVPAQDVAKLSEKSGGVEYRIPMIDGAIDALKVGSGLLTLTDEEFQKRFKKTLSGQPLLKDVKNFAELEKALSEIVAGTVGLASKAAIAVAAARNNLELVAQLEGIGSAIGKPVAGIAAVWTAVHSATVLLDDSSSKQERLDAAVSMAGAGATLVELGAGAVGATAVASVAFVAGAALAAAYASAKLYAEAYWAVRSDLMNFFTSAAFGTLEKAAKRIAKSIKEGDAAVQLLQKEQSDSQLEALQKALDSIHANLGAAVDGLLIVSAKGGYFEGARNPGSYTVLEQAFAPLQIYKGTKDPETLVKGAGEILKTIAWCYKHANKIFKAAAAGTGVESVNQMIQAEEQAQ